MSIFDDAVSGIKKAINYVWEAADPNRKTMATAEEIARIEFGDPSPENVQTVLDRSGLGQSVTLGDYAGMAWKFVVNTIGKPLLYVLIFVLIVGLMWLFVGRKS